MEEHGGTLLNQPCNSSHRIKEICNKHGGGGLHYEHEMNETQSLCHSEVVYFKDRKKLTEEK